MSIKNLAHPLGKPAGVVDLIVDIGSNSTWLTCRASRQGSHGICWRIRFVEPQPLYKPDHANPRYHLHYSWAAWPSGELFPTFDMPQVLAAAASGWESDGLRVLSHFHSPKRLQITFSARPEVAPTFLASRAKGRLQHALRGLLAKSPKFSRKVAVRSVGENQRQHVETYIEQQVANAHFADPKFQQRMTQYTVVDPSVVLSDPTPSSHGRYWYNLHVVLVCQERLRVTDDASLATLRDWCLKIADAKSYLISRLSVMPDHLHLSLRGHYEHSPLEIALTFQNNLSFALGQVPLWNTSFYAGTFSEYNMWAIRNHANTG